MKKLTLLIPANKESESLPIFLNELKEYNYDIVVVLQKEDYETKDSVKSFQNIKILEQKNNGYGNALKEGIEKIETEFFCIINADGSMDPKYLSQMLEDCNDRDFVFASRYLKNGGSDDDDIITFIGNKLFSFLGNILFNLGISDIVYTYILGRTLIAKKLAFQYHDFRICVEMPIKIKSKNYKYITTPSKERKRIAGKKKVNALKDGFLILIAIVGFFLKKITRF